MFNSTKLISYFDSSDISSKKTSVGRFVTSDLSMMNSVFHYLLFSEIIDSSGFFVDAGSGDGRINFLASSYNISSLGIEYDLDLHNVALRNKSELSKKQLVDPNLVRFAQGNFLDDLVYASVGVPFKFVKTFFNYINSPQLIAEKIAKDSPFGTKFLLLGSHHTYNFNGLKNLYSLKIKKNENDVSLNILTNKLKEDFSLSNFYLHIYEK